MTATIIPFPRTPSERLAFAAAPFAEDLAEKMAARKATRACIEIVGLKATAAFGDDGVQAKLESLGRYVTSGPNPGRGRWVLVVTQDRCGWVSLASMARARGAKA